MSDIQTLMRNANPIPDAANEFGPDHLDALLLLTRTRSTEMDAKEVTRAVEKDPRNKRSGWYVAAAAFGLVVLLVGSVVLLNRSSDPEIPPATTPPTTQAAAPTTTEPTVSTTEAPLTMTDQETATIASLVVAMNSGDWDAWTALHDPGFQVKGFPGPENTTSPLETWLAKYEADYLEGAEIALDCRAADEGQVLCSETIDGPVAAAIFFRPLSNTVRYQIADGVILGATWTCNTCFFSSTYWAQVEALIAWVESVDPEAALLLGDDPTSGDPVAWGEWATAWLEAGRP